MSTVFTLTAPAPTRLAPLRPSICRLDEQAYLQLAAEGEPRGRSACALCLEWTCPLNQFFVAHHCGIRDNHC